MSDGRTEHTRNPLGATAPSCNFFAFSGRIVTHHALDFRQISKNYLITDNFSFSFFRPDAAVPQKKRRFWPVFRSGRTWGAGLYFGIGSQPPIPLTTGDRMFRHSYAAAGQHQTPSRDAASVGREHLANLQAQIDAVHRAQAVRALSLIHI